MAAPTASPDVNTPNVKKPRKGHKQSYVTWQIDGGSVYGAVQATYTNGQYEVEDGETLVATEEEPVIEVQLHALVNGQLQPTGDTIYIVKSDTEPYVPNPTVAQMEDPPVSGWLSFTISEFKGKPGVDFPVIPLPKDIEKDAFGPDPFFVTLPVARIGARSRNNRVYGEHAVRSIIAQINAKRPEGRWGHLRDEDRATVYNPPAMRWLAAVLDDRGIAWAKGIPVTEEASRHLRVARGAQARVGTSIYGLLIDSNGDEVIDLNLESIDLADPSRVGVPDTASLVFLTREMHDPDPAPAEEPKQSPEPKKEEDKMSEQQIAELNQQLSAQKQLAETANGRIKELEPSAQAIAACAELLKVDGAKVFDAVKTISEQAVALTAENGKLLKEFVAAEIERTIKVPTLRGVVAELVTARQPATRDAVVEAIKQVSEMESVKAALSAQISAEMGPPVTQPITPSSGNSDQGAMGKLFVNPQVLIEAQTKKGR